ncbi:reverse transcriptase domain-containing protein [Tanacetum coccineum]
MRTRNSNFPNNSNVTIPRRRNRGRAPNVVEPELRTIVEVAPMAERTMEELLRAPTEGYGEAIVLPEINADHFEIKTNLLQLVQASPFHGYERENPHAHINSFKRITSTLRFRDVPNDVIKLMMFPYSLEGAAKVCEAWERFKEMLRACPHHGFTELTQVDTFYNGLNENDQDSLNVAAGGNLLSKTTREALNIIESKSKVRYISNKSKVSRGPSIPTNPSLKKVVERETVETTDKEQSNFQGSTAHIPPPVNPIPIPEPDVLKTLPKLNIPYPSRRNDQKSRDKASNQIEKIFQIFQDLRFDTSFADALLLMPRFAPTIRNLLMNKEKLLELAKIMLNENCSAMLLKKLPKKLGDPGKFLFHVSLPELTPTRMTLKLGYGSITHPKGLAIDVFVKVGSFHYPTDFVVVDFEADPRVPLILGRSFLRTSRALIDVYEGELILRDGNKQIIFHVDGISKHPQKHVNELIKMVNDTCEDSFEETNNLSSDSTTPLSDFHPSLESFETSNNLFLTWLRRTCILVCLPPPKDDDVEKEKQEVKNIVEPTAKRQTRITPCLKNFKVIHKESIFHSNKTPQISLVFAITSDLPTIKPKDSLIMGDEHLSTFRVEEIIPIPRESEDTFDNNKGCDLTFCDNNMIFSNRLFGSKDNLTFSNDNSILKEDVKEEKFQIYSNPPVVI